MKFTLKIHRLRKQFSRMNFQGSSCPFDEAKTGRSWEFRGAGRGTSIEKLHLGSRPIELWRAAVLVTGLELLYTRCKSPGG